MSNLAVAVYKRAALHRESIPEEWLTKNGKLEGLLAEF